MNTKGLINFSITLLFIFMFLFFFNGLALSQDSFGIIEGTISTNLKDNSNIKILLTGESNTKYLRKVTPDSNFYFKIKEIPFGEYKLQFYIDTIKIKSIKIVIDSINLAYHFEKIKINKSYTTEEIKIESEQNNLEYLPGKIVYKINGDPSNISLNLYELLKKLPLLYVDESGVYLRNSEFTIIKFNNSHLNLSGIALIEFLKSYTSDQILKIELITNPGVQFSSESAFGVINILSNKDEVIFNKFLNTSLNYNSTDSYYGNLNGSINNSDFFINGSMNYNILNRNSNNSSIRKSFSSSVNNLKQIGDNKNQNKSGYLNLSIEKNILTDGFINLSSSYFNSNNNILNKTSSTITNYYSDLLNNIESNLNGNSKFRNLKISSNIFSYFGINKNELDFYFDFINENFTSNNNWNILYKLLDSTSFYKSEYDTDIIRYNALFKIKLPITKQIVLNSGGEYNNSKNSYINNQFNINNNFLVIDSNLSNLFNYSNQVYSSFIETAFANTLFSLTAGLRIEHSLNNISSGNLNYNNNYTDYFPYLSILKEIDASSVLNLTYSAKLIRPLPNYLNPTIRRNNNSLFIYSGNPDLKPEYIKSIDLNYIKKIDLFNINLSIYYKNWKDVIVYSKALINSDTVFATYLNSGKSSEYGVDLNLSGLFFEFINGNMSFSFYRSNYSGRLFLETISNYTNTFSFKNFLYIPLYGILNIEINSNYQGDVLRTQGISKPSFIFNIGFTKSLLNEKLFVKFNFNDIFNSKKQESISNFSDSETIQNSNSNDRWIGISLSYRIGELNRSPKIKPPKEKIDDSKLKDEY